MLPFTFWTFGFYKKYETSLFSQSWVMAYVYLRLDFGSLETCYLKGVSSSSFLYWTYDLSYIWTLWLQLKKYYQPRKSHRIVSVNLEGTKVPLYGAGSGLVASANNAYQIPLTLQFDIQSRGYVVGKLVRTKHRVRISCPLVIDSISTKPMKFNKDSCFYLWWFYLWCTLVRL